jgi:hypothetical protein
MTERVQEPGADDTTTDGEPEGPQEILDAAADELAIPADESNEG